MKNVKHKNVFIRVDGSVSVADAVAHLEGLGYKNGWSGGFYPPSTTATISGDEYGLIGWCKLPDYCEENEYDETFISPKHKHYDLIVAWAENTSQKVWWKNPSATKWNIFVGTPCWDSDYIYHIGDQPPKHKIMIGDVEIDAPEVAGLAHGDEYFLPNASMPEFYSESRWTNDHYDSTRLNRGQIHLNKEAAIAHAKALIKVSGGCVDD